MNGLFNCKNACLHLPEFGEDLKLFEALDLRLDFLELIVSFAKKFMNFHQVFCVALQGRLSGEDSGANPPGYALVI